jgi:hypothetical protein
LLVMYPHHHRDLLGDSSAVALPVGVIRRASHASLASCSLKISPPLCEIEGETQNRLCYSDKKFSPRKGGFRRIWNLEGFSLRISFKLQAGH